MLSFSKYPQPKVLPLSDQQALWRLAHAMCRLIPNTRLRKSHRISLGSRATRALNFMSRYVGRALRDKSSLFTAIHLDGQELIDRADQGVIWKLLSELLFELAQRAADQHLLCSGTAVEDAFGVLARVPVDHPPMDEADEGRRRALTLARHCLRFQNGTLSDRGRPRKR